MTATGGVKVTVNGGTIESKKNTAVYLYRAGNSGQKEDYATFVMTGGIIDGGVYGLRHTHLNEITLSGGTIKGGKNQPDIYMAREVNEKSNPPAMLGRME